MKKERKQLQTEDFFYTRASKRIGERVRTSGLTHSQIYKPDHKQISRIINNDCQKNNRFLICDAVISNSYREETGEYIKCGLLETKKLNFKDIKEILWGDDSEISSYLYDLFETLWHELSESFPEYNINPDFYLCDYIPYAKYHSYFDIISNSKIAYPAVFYGMREDTIFENLIPSKEKALLFLYKKCKQQFTDLIFDFTNTHQSFHKLDKQITNELIPAFVRILESHKPDSNSLGLRVRELIYADLSHCAQTIAEQEYDDYRFALNNASSNYIRALEDIQNSLFINQ